MEIDLNQVIFGQIPIKIIKEIVMATPNIQITARIVSIHNRVRMHIAPIPIDSDLNLISIIPVIARIPGNPDRILDGSKDLVADLMVLLLKTTHFLMSVIDTDEEFVRTNSLILI